MLLDVGAGMVGRWRGQRLCCPGAVCTPQASWGAAGAAMAGASRHAAPETTAQTAQGRRAPTTMAAAGAGETRGALAATPCPPGELGLELEHEDLTTWVANFAQSVSAVRLGG